MNYLRLDDAFLKFVNIYVKEEKFRKPPDIFRAIEKIRADPLGTCLETTRYEGEGRIYWNESDYTQTRSESGF